jgi:hypothetical protein
VHERVLRAWYEERKQQLEKSLASTIENGRFVTEKIPLKVIIRDIYLWMIQLVPSWRHELRLGRRKEGMMQYAHSEGMPFLPAFNGGLCLPQVYCMSLSDERKVVQFTDDVIFSAGKKGLFQLLVYVKTLGEARAAREVVTDVEDMSNGEIIADETTFLVEDTTCDSDPNTTAKNMFRLATGEEFALSPLCERRPKPKFYDMLYLAKALKGMRFVLVRPDRFIYAACSTPDELKKVLQSAAMYTQGS